MPWKVTNVMDQKIRFVLRAVQPGANMSALCREFQISRPTGYKWLKRYREAHSVTGLEERSRRPRHSPARTAAAVEARVVELRRQYGWGGKKLQVLLEREGVSLSVPTVNRILRRQGELGEYQAQRPAPQRFERSQPNELWQMDFKGPFQGPEGPCHPLSILDDCSRYSVGLYGFPTTQMDPVQTCLRRTFEGYGVPEAMLMDHGAPWWSTSNGWGLTRLSVELIKQGIDLIYGRVRHPQTQGKVERFHRTLSDSVAHRGRPQRGQEWERFLQDFRQEYNQVRPHESLRMEVPAQHYRRSTRGYDRDPAPWEYPRGLQVKRLNRRGCLSAGGDRYFVCEALAEEWVGVEELEDKLLVRYRHLYIREVHLQTRQTRALVWRVGQD